MGEHEEKAGDVAAAHLAVSVASYALGVRAEEVAGRVRGSAQIAFARQVAMYLCHVGFELSLQRIAIAFHRDRSTVAYACHAIEDRRDEPRFDRWIAGLEGLVRRSPPRCKTLLRA